MEILQRHELRVGFQPAGLRRGEGVKFGGGGEALEGAAEQRLLVGNDAFEIHGIFRKIARLHGVEADEQGIACEGGEELVRGFAIAGRADR